LRASGPPCRWDHIDIVAIDDPAEIFRHLPPAARILEAHKRFCDLRVIYIGDGGDIAFGVRQKRIGISDGDTAASDHAAANAIARRRSLNGAGGRGCDRREKKCPTRTGHG
jgi:hypothetical protein